MTGYDLAVVGAGIVGLATALAASRKGLKVVVIEREAACVGASVRNFGFITVTGQQPGAHWQRARRSREVWAEVAPAAGIEILQRGLVVLARRPEAVAVAEAFLATPMGAACRLLSAEESAALAPDLRRTPGDAALFSPHELRVESRTAIPRLAVWLKAAKGVAFHWSTAVQAVAPPHIQTSRGTIEATACVVCPGADLTSLCAENIPRDDIKICTLQMLRVMPAASIHLAVAVMSDLSLARYAGFASLPQARALQQRLDQEAAAARAAGVHLIVVRSADGSLVVGDSHVYGEQPQPFGLAQLDQLILDELDAVLSLPGRRISERWTGCYPASSTRVVLVDRPAAAVRLVMVTGGTGASTAFALGEEVVDELFG